MFTINGCDDISIVGCERCGFLIGVVCGSIGWLGCGGADGFGSPDGKVKATSGENDLNCNDASNERDAMLSVYLAKTAGVKGKEVPTEEVPSEVDLSAMQD